jgi:hypothetical protein
MKLTKGIHPVLRAVGVVSAVVAIAGGATYAAMTNTATLADNTIESANANLQIWNGSTFTNTAPGFHVAGLVPDHYTTPQNFYFKNAGDTPLNVGAKVPEAPPAPEGGYGFQGWKHLHVKFTSNAPGCDDPSTQTTMAALLGLDPDTEQPLVNPQPVLLPCNPLGVGAQGDSSTPATEGNYSVQYKIDSSAVTGDNVGVGSFNVVFTGTVTSDEPEDMPSVD